MAIIRGLIGQDRLLMAIIEGQMNRIRGIEIRFHFHKRAITEIKNET